MHWFADIRWPLNYAFLLQSHESALGKTATLSTILELILFYSSPIFHRTYIFCIQFVKPFLEFKRRGVYRGDLHAVEEFYIPNVIKVRNRVNIF